MGMSDCARTVLKRAYPRAGSTAMPTGLPAPVGEPLFVISVFRYCTSPLNFKTWPSTNTNRCNCCTLFSYYKFNYRTKKCFIKIPKSVITVKKSNRIKYYLFYLNRLCSWIGVIQILCHPVQSQANRGAQNGCRGKLCPVSTI